MTKLLNQDTHDQVAVNNVQSEITSSTVDFRLSLNLIIIDATINGMIAPMILDTGAAATIIDREAVQKLGLKEARETIVGRGAGGDVEMASVEIESLSVGSVTHRGFTSMTMDMSEICGKLDDEVGGVIGFDFLSQLKLTIDYPARQLVFEETREDPYA